MMPFTVFRPVFRRPFLLSTLGTSLLLLPALASAGNLGVAGKLSLLGYGVEADYVLTDTLSVRGQFNRYNYDDTFNEEDIDYKGALKLQTFGALLDWHPFGGGFRLSGGGFFADNKLEATGSGVGSYEIGDEEYTVTAGQTLQADIDITLADGFKPYLGFGWGHSPANKGGLLLSFDVGVLFQGEPEVDLNVRGTATDKNNNTVDFSNDPSLQAEVTKERNKLKDDLKDFNLYPVLSFGIGWRF